MKMKLCNTHAHDLIKALQQKGLGAYISTSEAEAALKARAWLYGMTTRGSFDPYVVCVLEVFAKTKGLVHEHVIGTACPLCVVDQRLELGAARAWIDNVTDLMILVCRANDFPLRT
jgi:hypothetical protein